MSEKMKLGAWMTDEALRLAAFHAWYQQEHQKDPERFPLELEASMWDEAFMTFDPAQAGQGSVSSNAPMTIKGFEITSAQQDACVARMNGQPFKARQIAHAAMDAGVSALAADRLADRLIQKEKKAGRIKLGTGNLWKWVVSEDAGVEPSIKQGEVDSAATLVITEGVSGMWHYHVSRDERKTRALCGAKTMHTSIQLKDWRVQFGEHFPKKPTWCAECESIAKLPRAADHG